MFHELVDFFVFFLNYFLKLYLKTVNALSDLLKDILIVLFYRLSTFSGDINIAEKQVWIPVFQLNNFFKSVILAVDKILLQESVKLGQYFLVDFFNKGKNMKSIISFEVVIFPSFSFARCELYFIDSVLKEHELF